MQEQENTEKSPLSINIELSKKAEEYLGLASKWAKVISILSFIFIGTYALFVISGTLVKIVEGEVNMLGIIVLATTLLMAGIYFIPSLYLYRFAKTSKSALEAKDEGDLEKGLYALGISFRFVGFILILLAIIYAFGMIIAINDIRMIFA
ncbi:MAG: hypothetical protein AAGD28_30465 [Bacteroidota bacterium]